MIKKTSALLLLIVLPMGMASGPSPADADKVLDVPLRRQETRMWCWAASLQMILGLWGQQVSQCEQVDARLNRTDCCGPPASQVCVRGGWPNFAPYGYLSDQRNAPLSWKQLKRELDSGRPVAFSWAWKKGGGHMMVAVGYKEPNWVYVNDPFVPDANAAGNESDYVAMTYEKFVSSAKHTHLRDYFNIRIKPENALTGTGGRLPDIASTGGSVGGPSPETEALPDTRPRPVNGFSAIVRALKYPRDSALSGFRGQVTVKVLVEKNGEVAAAKVSRSSGRVALDEAAMTAARAVKWRPGTKNGGAVRSWAEVPMSLNIQ